MFNKWKERFTDQFSGKQAYRYAECIAQYHRIQASPGYRKAAHEVLQLLQRDGVDAKCISYPAKFGDRFLSHQTFQEWKCRSAELWIEGPERQRIARFEEEEISIIQRSISTSPDGIVTEMVVVDSPEDARSYETIDIKGKIALVRGNPSIIHALAVEKHGAAGLVFDNLNEYPPFRTRLDLPDTRQYTSFWWHSEQEIKSFGFVVSPRIGEKLRQMAQHTVVHLKATVNAELFDGEFENIEYFIPGKQKEEILLVSHLCHPYPGGQDNASGPGILMEVMRTMTNLIKDDKLSKPDLGIRFLLMPEMNGTCAYFSQHPERIPLTVAALNLDMVGADQTKGGGPLCIEQPPMATPTFVDRYAYHLVEELAQNTKNFSGTTTYSTTHYVKTRFSGGSDHYIISDPLIGIPCPMFIQWPDKHYHTTSDSPGNLDENMMKLVGLSSSLYAYGLANGDESEWLSYLLTHTSHSTTYMIQAKDWLVKQSFNEDELTDALSLYLNYEQDALEKIEQYARIRNFKELEKHIGWAKKTTQAQAKHIAELVNKELLFGARTPVPIEDYPWMNKVYQRVYQSPLRLGDEIMALSVDERIDWLRNIDGPVPMGYSDYLFYWMDGKRTIGDILVRTKQESGMYFSNYTAKLIELCLKLKLIKEVGEHS